MAMLLCLVSMCSCMTRSLWEGRGIEIKTVPKLLDETSEQASGQLAFGGEAHVGEAWLRGEDGRPKWSMISPYGGDPVAVVMAGRFGPVERVQVGAVRNYVDADVTLSRADVAVFSRFEPERVGHEAAWGTLEDEAAVVLDTTRRNAFAFVADPWLRFPRVYRECLQRLDSVALGQLLVDRVGGGVDVQAFVLVDDEGLPCFEPGSTRRPAPALADEEVTFAERLDLLSRFDAIVRVRVADRDYLLRLDLEQLWLWSSAEQVGDLLVHRGAWNLFPADPERPGGESGRLLAYDATIRTRRYELVTTMPFAHDPQGFWEKVAWSFLTVPLDILTLPFQGIFDDEDEDEQRRRGVRERR